MRPGYASGCTARRVAEHGHFAFASISLVCERHLDVIAQPVGLLGAVADCGETDAAKLVE